MTRQKLEEEKRKHLRRKPVMDTLDYLRFQKEMSEWDARLKELEDAEAELSITETYEKMEMLAKIANLEKRRANRLETMALLKKKYKSIGVRTNRAADYKLRQAEIVEMILDLEDEVNAFTADIDSMVGKMLADMGA